MRVVYRGAVFADATDFDKCVALWMHALDIKQNNLKNTPVAKDVLRFAQVISNIMCRSCHLGWLLNVQIGVQYRIFAESANSDAGAKSAPLVD